MHTSHLKPSVNRAGFQSSHPSPKGDHGNDQAATEFLAQMTPKPDAQPTALLFKAFDQAIGFLRTQVYLTADRATTLKTRRQSLSIDADRPKRARRQPRQRRRWVPVTQAMPGCWRIGDATRVLAGPTRLLRAVSGFGSSSSEPCPLGGSD